jgi:hypothetical protein
MTSRRAKRRSTLASRRSALCTGGLGLLGLGLPDFLAGRALASDANSSSFGKARACILLFMWGGPAHQDTWDLKPNAPREIRGEFSPISTNVPGTFICEHMPKLSQRVDRLAIIRSMTHGNVDHLTATHFLLTGQPPPPVNDLAKDWPSYGAVLTQLGRGKGTLPPFISFRPKVPGDVPRFVEQSHGQFGGWLGPTCNPLTIDDDPNAPEYRVGDFVLNEGIDRQLMEGRQSLLSQLNTEGSTSQSAIGSAAIEKHYQQAFDLLASGAAAEAFKLDDEPAALRDRYGRNPHGQSVLQARRLVERGVPLVTVFWPNDGIKNVSVYWDTHSRNFIDLKERLMPVTDQAFSALLDDLADRGMLDETLVLWTGEFGRTPKVGQVNSDAGAGRDGRDHWPGCFTSVLAGGGVKGGVVYGASDRHAAYPSDRPTMPVDLAQTVYHCLGVPPDLELHDRQGRPMAVCPGQTIRDILV